MSDASDLLSRLGLDDEGRKARLAWVGYALRDEEHAARLRAVLSPRHADLVDRFLARLTRLPEFLLAVGDSAKMMGLRDVIGEQLAALGQDVGSRSYVESRLRLGLALERGGAPLPLCTCLGAHLEGVVTEILLEETVPAAEREKLNASLRKLMLFDLSLLVDAYSRRAAAALDAIAAPPPAVPAPTPSANVVLEAPALAAAFEVALRAAENEGQALAIALVSVDELPRLTAQLGPARVEEICRQVALRLAYTVRAHDAVGLHGDRRLLVLLGQVSTRAAVSAAERFRALIATQPIETSDGGSRFVTISQGVASFRTGTSAAELLERAESALASAQRSGRDRVVASSG